MARFSEVITLRETAHETDAQGRVRPVFTDTEVFFNRYTMGLQQRLAAASEGLRGVVEGQVRSADYAGQGNALLSGRAYTVTEASDSGEFTRLTLTERAEDGE